MAPSSTLIFLESIYDAIRQALVSIILSTVCKFPSYNTSYKWFYLLKALTLNDPNLYVLETNHADNSLRF
jgi:hypothetical protein